MNDKQSDGQSPCCEGGDCCQPGKTEGNKRSNRWRIAVFAGVILLACGVAAYSLFWRGGDVASSSCCGTGSAECATPCTGPNSIAGFDDQLEGADFALVLFLPAGEVLSQEAGAAVDAARADVESRGSHVQMLNMYSSDSAFAKAADRYKITDFPALLLTGKGGDVVLAQTDISKDAILRIYEQDLKTIQADSATQGGQGKIRDTSGVD